MSSSPAASRTYGDACLVGIEPAGPPRGASASCRPSGSPGRNRTRSGTPASKPMASAARNRPIGDVQDRNLGAAGLGGAPEPHSSAAQMAWGPEEVNGYLLFLVPDQQPTVVDPECGPLSGREARDALGTRFQQPQTLQSPYATDSASTVTHIAHPTCPKSTVILPAELIPPAFSRLQRAVLRACCPLVRGQSCRIVRRGRWPRRFGRDAALLRRPLVAAGLMPLARRSNAFLGA